MEKKVKESEWNTLFRNEFSKESDRAGVILSVAMLDQTLETLLKSYLVPSGSSEDSLLEGKYAPLSSFSSRIDMAYRLGLISIKLCRDLHIIRKIRNEFAHNITECNFENSRIRDKIREIERSSGIFDRMPQLVECFSNGAKGEFEMTVSWMLWCMNRMINTIKSLKPAELERFYVPKVKDPKN